MKNKNNALSSYTLSELVALSKIIGDDSLQEASETDSVDSFPEKTLSKLLSAQLLKASVSKKFGGQDLGLICGTNLALLKILKNIGRGNPVMGRVLEGHINALLLIDQFGNEKQKKMFARDALGGRLFGVWNTQAENGTFLSVKKNGKYSLSGAKTFATGTDFVSRPIVTAAMPDGSWQMCVVPLEKVISVSDASWWNPMGMKASRSFKISFVKAVVSKKNILGAGGDYYRQPAFGGGAIRFAAVQLGAAEKLSDETKKYLKDLNRTDDPYQKRRLGEMAIAVESGNQWIHAAALQMDLFMKNPGNSESESLVIYANMMRTATEHICSLVISLCQKCVGARGLNKPYHFERMIRDLSTYLRQPAPDAVLAEVGAYILKNNISAGDLWNHKS
ncbi:MULTISPECIES: acyl-CoA dehydrogenase family protein [unclassified Chryseobacterium]|uniref:acyl-CoA dehydrogenase family protein n=1 Tax=unclassified Chryseobacterium TaxID=2593645 RepID=UPI0009E93086|nr:MULTISPECIES: acyl-CoA dehydrogenase family protein [unclassified Chryseobacterium]